MNPLELIKDYIAKGVPPEEIAKKMVGNNPILNRLVEMQTQGNNQGLETFAKNILKERGLDLDKELASFKQALNIK